RIRVQSRQWPENTNSRSYPAQQVSRRNQSHFAASSEVTVRGYLPLDDATGFEHLYLAICSAFVRTSLSTNASRSTGLVRFPVVTSRSRIQASLFMGIAISGSTADKRLISS